MGPLFPRLHVSDAGKGGGPRAPPRNKMALYEQFTVPSSRFSSFAASTGAVPSTSASQVYGYDRPLFQPFNAPSNEPAHSSEKIKRNLLSQGGNNTRKEPGRLSSQTKNNDVYAGRSAAECTSQHRADITTNKYSGKKLVNDDECMVPSICFPRFAQNSVQGHPGVQESSNSLCATSPHKNPPAASKLSAKFDNAVNKNSEGINVSDMRSRTPPKAKDKEPAQGLRTFEVEKISTIQASKDKSGYRDVRVSSSRDKLRPNNTNDSDRSHLGNNGRQDKGVHKSSINVHSPTTKNTVSCKPSTNLDNTSRSSYLREGSLNRSGIKRKGSLKHQDTGENDDLSDSSMECIHGCELSPDDIVNAIGPKNFWKTRRAIQNQQRIFSVQVFELHKLIKVQKIIAASPHLLIEGDPCLGSSLADKNNQPKRNLKVQTLLIKNKDDTQPTLEQPELSKENTEANPPSPSLDNGPGGGHHDGAAINGAFMSNLPAAPAAPDNKQSNWCVNPPQNQWLVPVMSPSEGLVYKAYAGPCPPAGSLLAPFSPFYANCAPLRLPSAAYGVPMPHQPQHIAPPGAPTIPLNYNYFPPFSLPVMNPGAPVSAVEQGSHAAASQPNDHVEQQSRISCNMTHPSGIWRFHASRDSEAQGSCASSPFDRPQGDGSGPVLHFPAASVQNAQPDQPSSVSRDKGSHVIRVVPHNAHTASESAARIFRSIQMERQCNNS